MEFLHSKPMPVADHFMASNQRIGEQDNGYFSNRSLVGVVCETCFAYFTDDTELWLHVRWEHGKDRTLACPVPGCGKRFLARDMRKQHLAHHGGIKYVQDTVLGVRTPVPVVARPYTCELCGRLLANQMALDKHTANKHPNARRYICGVCTLMVRDVPALTRHARRRHAAELMGAKRTLRCDVCAKLLGNTMMLRKHRSIHGVSYDRPI